MPDLESFFHPRSVAVVGAQSDAAVSQGAGVFVPALIAAGFKGDIYPVNPKANAIMGLKTYPDLMSVPQTPDFVICCLAAARTPQLMRDCIGKGVKAVCIYSAGFSEASENGRKLEQELVMLARRGGIRMMGPNCMGIYCPSAGLSYNPRASREPGSVGLVCQSGGNSLRLTMLGESLGLRFSKVVSYGNAADVSEADFLEYLADDTETEVIGAYIEGVREGQRFVRALAYAADRKPVIVLKGGRTQAGSQAAASHTGAVASSKATWDALCQQARAVQAYSLE
ncbi:MAG: CoA-binding protein, partial [Chloroflexi bacterium]|nr:CoA-binding protein [Chloroflexota bacterium]